MRQLHSSTGGSILRVRLVIFPVLLILLAAVCGAQNGNKAAGIKGVVRDSNGHPVPNATVNLESKTASLSLTSPTDSQGAYSFLSLPSGTYMVRALLPGGGHAQLGPFSLGSTELKTADLTLSRATSSDSMPGFYDEPQFTVAGVTQTGNAGGHGSETIRRNSEALTKAAVSLSNPSQHETTSESTLNLEHTRAELHARLAQKDTAELHHSLAEVEERLANPLEAVHEYQRAAEMEPSEPYVFDWGVELLAHRALEPATEVFAKGHRLFPKSARMLMGLGVSLYARGQYEQALQRVFEASDLNPSDSTPYLFLGKMQAVETIDSPGFVEKFGRFVALQPENAFGNYYYAVSLWRQSLSNQKKNNSDQIRELLQRAIQLDPKMSAAYLQLGILFSEKGDLPRAITEYQKALESDPDLYEAHYRLGQAYRRTGDTEKARQELKLYQELSKKSAEQADRERREIQRFVVTLRSH